MTKPLHFWYEFASPYACLAALRIEDEAKKAGVDVIWHPFLLGAIFKKLDMPGSPMLMSKQKTEYMWKDAKRMAKRYGIPLSRPSVFPRVAVLPARVALFGRGEGWCPEFSRQVYLANFTRDEDISKPEVLGPILEGMGLNARVVFEKALSDDNKLALRRDTEQAYKLGVFGVPTLFAGDEMFWGNDRLEYAIEACLS